MHIKYSTLFSAANIPQIVGPDVIRALSDIIRKAWKFDTATTIPLLVVRSRQFLALEPKSCSIAPAVWYRNIIIRHFMDA